jgi:RNA polymerase sigma factor (sigma-70 family)
MLENYTQGLIIAILENLTEFYSNSHTFSTPETVIEKVDIENALNQLSYKQKRVLLYYYVYGFDTHEEVGRRLGISPRTVGDLKLKGLKKLESILKGECY